MVPDDEVWTCHPLLFRWEIDISMTDRTGQQLGNYHLVRLLGHGGQAEVYLGEHRYLKSLAALKVLYSSLDEQHSEQFLAEAQTLARLVHPSIIRILDFTVEQDIPVLIMDYSPAGTMRQRYPPGTCLPLATVVSAVSQVASALHYAHSNHVIHRDVKPENLLLGPHDEVLLSDFGLSVFAPSPELLSTQTMSGTLPYMAPEQLQGHPCFASDQYSLAIVVYEWLTGTRPFKGSQWQLIQQQLYAPPPPLRERNPEVPAEVEEVVLRALAKDPQERYRSVQSFAQALARASQVVLSPKEDVAEVAPLQFPPFESQHESMERFDYSTRPRPSLVPQERTGEKESSGTPGVPSQGHHVKAEQMTSPNKDVNRQRLLAKVYAFWITGVLEHSLHGAALIALGLREQPDAVANPWHLTLETLDESAQALPVGTSIVQVYDAAAGELLILGEPGAGKTTLLLELTRTLLHRAGEDDQHPLPVVFNLSSWASRRQSLTEWLIEELHSKYQVPHKVGTSWVETDYILPLLDGLDEVAPTSRATCVEAINIYRLQHGLVPMVVCCRRAEYLTLTDHILLREAVVVQPLTEQQIDVYLSSAGSQLESVRAALQDDAALQELAVTPLMLSVLTLAYHGTSAKDLLVTGPPEVRRLHVFGHYVERMLSRRASDASYSLRQTRGGLAWLAQQMKQQSQTIFYLERMQPDWLSGESMMRAYDRWAVRFPDILMGVLVSLIVSLLLCPLVASFAFLILNIFLGGLIGWMLSAERTIRQPPESSGKARIHFRYRLLTWLRTSVLIGLAVGLGVELSVGSSSLISIRLSSGVGIGLGVGLGSILLQAAFEKINTTASGSLRKQPSLRPKWQYLMKSTGIRNGILVGLLLGLSVGLSGGLIDAGILGWRIGLLTGLSTGLLTGLSTGLSSGLLSVLLTGKSVGISPTDELVWSWRSLVRSLLTKKHINATLCVIALIGVSASLGFGLSTGLSRGLRIGLSTGLSGGLLAGLLAGLCFWLIFGLFQGVSSETVGDQHRVVPNQGIRRSARNSLMLGLVCAGTVWLSVGLGLGLIAWVHDGLNHGLFAGLSPGLRDGLSFWLSLGLSSGLDSGLLIGLSAGLLVGLLNGGLACLRHGVIRFLLWRAGAIPWRYPHFLDYAAERILLRKVGGGYIFVHRLLLEYFASLQTTPHPGA
jgi:serine/threonine protein kinase